MSQKLNKTVRSHFRVTLFVSVERSFGSVRGYPRLTKINLFMLQVVGERLSPLLE